MKIICNNHRGYGVLRHHLPLPRKIEFWNIAAVIIHEVVGTAMTSSLRVILEVSLPRY